MISRDKLLLQAALNKDTVIYSNIAKVANAIKRGEVIIEIDERTNSILFKYRKNVVRLDPRNRTINNLESLNDIIKFVDDGFKTMGYQYMKDDNVWKKF